jgi:hypothetical protein
MGKRSNDAELQQKLEDRVMLSELVQELAESMKELKAAQRKFAAEFRAAVERKLGLCNVEFNAVSFRAIRQEADEEGYHATLSINVGK